MPSRFHLSTSTPRAALVLLLVGAGVLAAIMAGGSRAATLGGAMTTAPYEPGVVVVGLRSTGPTARADSALARTGIVRASEPDSDFTTVVLRPHVSVAAALARLRRQRSVAWAVPDYIAHAANAQAAPPAQPFDSNDPLIRAANADLPAPFDPNDPGKLGTPGGWRALQWNFDGEYGVNAPQAWANLIADGHPGGSGVTVAVLDTGVAYANRYPFARSPDFTAGEFVKGYDFIAHNAYPEDRNGHGTEVAGTIAEATNNGIGVTGLAYGVRVMPVRVLDSQGNGGAATIAEGIRWAVAHHAQIINLSLEFTAGTVKASSIPELIGAIGYALNHNVLVVAAAGNEGVGQLSYPAKIRGVVAVGATTLDGCLGYYSNYGTGLTLVAPGGGPDADVPGDPHCHPTESASTGIYQETFANMVSPHFRRFGLPAWYYGTSMAAPHVSATAALIIASGVLGPHPTVAQIITQLAQTATKLGPGTDGDPRYYGAGLINAATATEPVGSTGPSGPSGPTGPTG
jgi:serine protease